MRRIDVHCHPNTEPWYRATQPYIEALREYWRRPWQPQSEEEFTAELEGAGVEAIVVAHDTETVTGLPPCGNDYVAGLRHKHSDVILQVWGAVDPWKGDAAIVEAERAVSELGVLGFHFHPICGGFSVADRRLYPLWETISGHGVPIMVDAGFSGMGAGLPGGLGRRLKHARPFPALDDLAADFPSLTIVAAHPAWPWTDEMIAITLHKSNVFWELSGWGPEYFPDALKREIRTRLQDKVMFGSDYPSLSYERLFRGWESLGYSDEIIEKVFWKNAERLLDLGAQGPSRARVEGT
ncbi:MAG: amidohydrolase family protein [Thermoleophilaceae bacterium]